MKLFRVFRKTAIACLSLSYLFISLFASNSLVSAQTGGTCTLEFKYFIYTGDYSTQLNKELPDNDPLWVAYTSGQRVSVKQGERMRLRARVINNSHSVNKVNTILREPTTIDLNVSGIIERIQNTNTFELKTGTSPTASGDVKFIDQLGFPYQIDVLFKNPTTGTANPTSFDTEFEVRVHLNDNVDGIDCTNKFLYQVASVPNPTPQITPTPPATPDPCAKTGDWRDADINQDKVVNVTDFTTLQAAFGQKPPANCRVDINRDGVVNIVDFSLLQKYFGEGGILTPESPDPGNTGGPAIPPVITE